MEVAIEAEKLELQSVMQRYALLCHTAQTLPHGKCITNRERLSLYCELQRLREAFYGLPRRAQPVADRQKLLRHLDEMEAAQCTALNFRDEALTLWQSLTCQLCFTLYVLCFCVVDPVMRRLRFGSVERLRRHGLHAVSVWIMHCLQIPTSMTFEKALPTRSGGSTGDNDDDDPFYVVFSPQHWIEVVGFWSCPTNPLLHDPRVQLLLAPDGCRALPFEVLWQGVQQEMRGSSAVVETSNDSSKAPTHDTGVAEVKPIVQSTFGYPLALRVADGGEEVAAAPPRLLPVVSAGLPRVLFVSDAVARSDVQMRRTQQEAYEQVRQRQYNSRPGAATGGRRFGRSDENNAAAAAAATTAAGSVTECGMICEPQLRAWRKHGGVPLWHRVTWGATYGGVGREGNRDRRELAFRVGRLCHARELIAEEIKLQQQQLMLTMAEGEEAGLLSLG
ncbi:hypothetical protein DQ04_04501020 [Trypanosoma grayi]|uniref:hypothetical protein n=1 Tax=Trypanosoma grayi TaxID=71804 RepID=UPI0004F4B488|nr:hypothetical protein DQ04_04501020 [Trypanosoma grayi]KEG09876.1 hypothetical protein DQ04_04501020 [Trypanosoma grayi]